MIRQDFEHKPRKRGKKTRQGAGNNSKFGRKGSKKYYRKKPRGQGK